MAENFLCLYYTLVSGLTKERVVKLQLWAGKSSLVIFSYISLEGYLFRAVLNSIDFILTAVYYCFVHIVVLPKQLLGEGCFLIFTKFSGY